MVGRRSEGVVQTSAEWGVSYTIWPSTVIHPHHRVDKVGDGGAVIVIGLNVPPYSTPEYGATYSGKSTVPSFVIHHHFRFGWINVFASSRMGVRASSITIRAILRAS